MHDLVTPPFRVDLSGHNLAKRRSEESSLEMQACQKRLSAGNPADVLDFAAEGNCIDFVDAAESECGSSKQDLTQFAEHFFQYFLLIADSAVRERDLQQLL